MTKTMTRDEWDAIRARDEVCTVTMATVAHDDRRALLGLLDELASAATEVLEHPFDSERRRTLQAKLEVIR